MSGKEASEEGRQVLSSSQIPLIHRQHRHISHRRGHRSEGVDLGDGCSVVSLRTYLLQSVEWGSGDSAE